ncbi:MAG: YigZ family protein [Bacteroidetes bacterium]|nr:YigZ family protein [Bacteroidota bacterium]
MPANDTYRTIASSSSGQYRDRGSRFIALAYPVEDEESIKQILMGLRKEYHDALHHCYAWVLGADKSSYRLNDDGEPSGSAGRPIYGQMVSNDLTNVLIVVVRYFGGTKLGIPGLINAYRTAAREALDQAIMVTKTVKDFIEINFDYQAMNDVMKIMKEENIEQIETAFDLRCRIIFTVRKLQAHRVCERLSKINNLKFNYLKSQ